MSTMTPAERVAAYIKLRDYKQAATEEFKKSLERVNAAMEKLEGELLQDLDTSGANSLRCDAGTVYRNVQMSATVNDRNAFLDFVRHQAQWEALDVKVNKTFVRDYMEETGQPIPGVKVSQIATVGVRRSS